MTGSATEDIERIHAVVVTHRPDSARLEQLLAALASEGCPVLLIDNATPQWDPQSIDGRHSVRAVRQLPGNEGLASAQNAGIALARARRASCVLLMDQDSVPQPGMVRALWDTLQRLRQSGVRVACVGSRQRLPHLDGLTGFATLGWLGPKQAACRGADRAVECDTLIASGSLIPMDVLDAVGGMDESLFIDLVDTEWCFRARAKGYRVFGACGAVLEHRLGDSARRVWAGRWRSVPRHPASRYYYIFRNTVLVGRRDFVPLKWLLYYLRWLATLFLVHGVFARDRAGELGMMVRGALDGVRGISGRLGDR